MTARETLVELLKKQRDLGLQDKLADRESRLREWVQALQTLMAQLLHWVEELQSQHLLAVETMPVPLKEEQLGTYTATGLKIVAPTGVAIQVRPRARYVVGSLGRVDLECAPKKALLVRKEPGKWQFASLAPQFGGWAYRDLTEESFWETLGDLLS